MPEQAQSPFYNFPRFFPMRGGGGGYQAGNAGAISRFGDDIAQSLMQIKAQMDQKKQDELANAMMNNGQSPGAAPYVRRAEYPDGDQGDDPGPVPFASTDTPYSGGAAQQQALAASLAGRPKPMSDYEAYQVAHPEYLPGSRRLTPKSAGGGPRQRTSKQLPPTTGDVDQPLPVDEPAMAPTASIPAQAAGAIASPVTPSLSGIVSAIGNMFTGGGNTAGAPTAPSDPIAAGRAIKSDPSLSREQKIAKLRELGFK